ncbi:hypothetical protein C8Q77DRAFT_1103109 [Trametes polyzona]|nr:hypothetical protein C8Q77DRAFT_1103109 [Trametes polyzona]
MQSTQYQSKTLRALNDDCLRMIYAFLRPQGALRPLSLTCRWLREDTKPVLFERSYAIAAKLDGTEGLPPPVLWPYIRCIVFLGPFDMPIEVPTFSEGFIHGQRIARTCSEMPQLHGIVVESKEDAKQTSWPFSHITAPAKPRYRSPDLGIPWDIISILLTTPQVREFHVRGPFLQMGDVPPWYRDFNPSPLTSFQITLGQRDRYPWGVRYEQEALAIILRALSTSLQTLSLPSESLPLHSMTLWRWPRLQHLCICGHARSIAQTDIPLFRVLSRMPSLVTLSLLLAPSTDDDLQPVIPARFNVDTLPWPELRSLATYCPSPMDQILDHLPPTLDHLSLRSWPRSYQYYLNRGHGQIRRPWAFITPLVSDVLRALHRIGDRRLALKRLEVAYSHTEEEEQELELVRYISAAFPDLQALYLHRNQRASTTLPPMNAIAKAVSCLQHLRLLRIYLDIHEYGERRGRRAPISRRSSSKTIDRHVAEAVAAVVDNPGPSLQYLHLLPAPSLDTRWRVYRLERDQAGVVHAYLEDDAPDFLGYSVVGDD